ncbi:hypothetical protein ES677_07460 [Bizionia gelidisalsuginis]|uniref:Uncharacterized protein n=1 Tax=Bizionia gelidisalsuginis TaxID=291188 RepID=A0ABY3MAJ9_9FLAO|nr:hypothetical protein [Bizionia gelidisalsuginis]TYC12778.1 hypothetical protein ES677_07460 [Bizionia gelidisalsuginis]
MKLLYTLVFMLTLSAYNVKAQSVTKQSLTLVKYNDNVTAPLTIKERSFIKEVYADKFEEYVMNRPQKLKDLKNLLRNRVLIRDMPDLINNPEKYTLLSETDLFNIYNSTLNFDKTYNKETFNVLKYNLQFFGRGSKVYRIDNTSYFIIIKSQHH